MVGLIKKVEGPFIFVIQDPKYSFLLQFTGSETDLADCCFTSKSSGRCLATRQEFGDIVNEPVPQGHPQKSHGVDDPVHQPRLTGVQALEMMRESSYASQQVNCMLSLHQLNTNRERGKPAKDTFV